MSEKNTGRKPAPPRRRGPMGGGPPGMMPGEKASDFKGSTLRLMTYLRPQLIKIIFVFIMAVLSVAFSLAGPKIMARGTNIIFNTVMERMKGNTAVMDFSGLLSILLWLVCMYALSSVFSYFQNYIMAGISKQVTYSLRKETDEKLDRLPLKFFDDTPRGEILSRVTNDVENISTTLQQSLLQIVSALCTMVGVIIVMFTISWQMTLICLIILPVVFFLTGIIMKHSQKYFARQWESTGTLNSHVEEMFTGHRVVQAFGRESDSIAAFNAENKKLYEASRMAQFISGINMPLMQMMNNINFVIICAYGGLKVATNTMTLGDVQAMTQYARSFTHPIQQTASMMNLLQSTAASAERVFALLDETEQIPDCGGEQCSPTDPNSPEHGTTGEVTFSDVSFRYKEDVPLIENMNLHVKPGQRIAIVGPTGAGKTTLVNLLMRFYELDGGVITVDGSDIKSVPRSTLRAKFGMVLQDTWLFSGTIRQNIAYSRTDATDEEIYSASRSASADHFIRTLEQGYDTELRDDANSISQGQRQLLTIARAFLSDPEILILDEATSSVDTRTEVLIQEAMEKLMRGRTSFIIAHRLSTIRNADVILVMRDGAIVEQGSHEELLSQGGFYAGMYYTDLRSQEANAAS